MTFLQPYLLWMLPLVVVPVVIHLLNRMRYRSVTWAAMEFLFAATRQSTRQAKLRHWLILLCRTLAVLAIILALARPLVGGWLGWAFTGAPDTVILLLDRSASMEQQEGQSQTTKRARAVQRLVEAATQLGGASRLVLIESGTRQAQEISSPAVLPEVSLTAATDAAADVPAMLQAAVEYVLANQCGRTEFWLASDFQASNWRADSPQWVALMERIKALPQEVRVRLLGLTETPGDNLGVAVRGVSRQKSGAEAVLDLTLEITHNRSAKTTFPLAVVVDGHRSTVDVTLDGQQMRLQHRVRLGDAKAGGSGWVELPADSNGRDNRAYFAYNPETHLRALVVCEDAKLARLLQVATVPAPTAMNQSADVVTSAELATVKWDDVALVPVATGMSLPPEVGKFAESGGVVVVFPAGKEFEAAVADTSFRVTTWRGDDGPLAKTQDGAELPVADLRCARRQIPVVAARDERGGPGANPPRSATAATEEGIALASFADGKPFLVRQQQGKGAVYFCATLPVRDWSNLAEGTVLVPMLQRLMQEGGRRLGQVQEVHCGEEVATAAGETWKRLEPEKAGTISPPPLEAGIYQVSGRVVPVNRPPVEDESEIVDETKVRGLFGAVPVRLLEEKADRGGQLQSEVWRMVLVGALLFLLGEGLLTMVVAAGKNPVAAGTPLPHPESKEIEPVEVGR